METIAQTGDVEVRRATIEDLDTLVPLFDAYRQFYRQPSAPTEARRFLRDRLEQNESIVFLALVEAAAVGFTQLYPSFSSAAMARIFILNDLFVAPEARRRGGGAALLQAATEHGRRAGAARLALSTELNNKAAQSLYEKAGWRRDTVFCTYQLTLATN
ncbi:MAG TPA: GNAT family N-acetyltransferase [Bryobacteraceae bacterium]|jgi:ribosomal protein S18 acetylase RimI-like enzyme|nr:GNAT family N-acetyltransferase [Bryobacteraceae bacterium]